MLCVPSIAIQRVDMSQVFVELNECLALEMAQGRRQSMATEVNQTFQAFHSKFRCNKLLVRNFRCNILQKIIGISLYNDLFILRYYNNFS